MKSISVKTTIRKLAVKAAKSASDYASWWDMHQIKEPKAVKKIK